LVFPGQYYSVAPVFPGQYYSVAPAFPGQYYSVAPVFPGQYYSVAPVFLFIQILSEKEGGEAWQNSKQCSSGYGAT
jgi:hypothetical protein